MPSIVLRRSIIITISITAQKMKTHMNNTKALQIFTNYDGKIAYANHQHTMNTQKIKPAVDTRRKSQIKIVNNNKIELNQQPLQHVNKLFTNILGKKYKSTIDNKTPACYETGKKILKDRLKKNPKENFIQKEHQRELQSQASRVKNCKSLVQRKKDNTDPIVNPTYFMRDGNEAKSVTIEGYKKTVLHKNRPTSAIPASNNPTQKQLQAQFHSSTKHQQMPSYQNFGSVPNLSTHPKKPKTAPTQNRQKPEPPTDDLPQCTFKAILNHIVDNKMFRDVDMKVLYVRLCHRYGEERVEDLWGNLMDQLER